MRVLLFSATPRADGGGVQAVIKSLHIGLVERDAIVLRAGPDEAPAPGHAGLTLEAGASGTGRPSAAAFPKAAASMARLAVLLARFRPEVVNLHFITGAVAYFMALRPIFGFRLVLSAHGGDLKRAPTSLRPHLRRFLRSADAVTVVSDDLARTARSYAEILPGRLVVIPNGIDSDFWCPGSGGAPEPAGIVAAGRLQDVKGFDLLIRALEGLREARLTIHGEGPERGALTELAERLGVSGRLELPGHRPPEVLRDSLRNAAVFALPSRSEGMPLALIEALGCGTPAVAAKVGGVAEVLTSSSGLLVEPEDVEALRGGLRSVLSGDASVSRAGARDRALVFSETRTIESYLELFRNLSDPCRRPEA